MQAFQKIFEARIATEAIELGIDADENHFDGTLIETAFEPFERAIFLAGAYGLSASPQAFLGHPQAREIVVGGSS